MINIESNIKIQRKTVPPLLTPHSPTITISHQDTEPRETLAPPIRYEGVDELHHHSGVSAVRRQAATLSILSLNSAGTAGPIRTGDGSFDAPERRNDVGGGHVAPCATWQPPTCYVPPREPFEKCCFRAAARTGSGREAKLSGQKRLGLNCVSLGESIPRGQNCAPRGQFFQPSAL